MRKRLNGKNFAGLSLLLLLVIIVISVILLYGNFGHEDKIFSNTFSSMGVRVHQTVDGLDSETAAQASQEKIRYIEDKLSFDIDGSDVDRINSGAGEKWVKCSPETLNSLAKVIDISKKSFGTIDPTVLPLTFLWKFDQKISRLPDKSAISSALPHIDYRNVKVNHDVGRVKLSDQDALISLSQVEKAVACSSAIDVYKNFKIDCAVISVGNIVGVYGVKSDNSAWNISVKDPFISRTDDAKIAVLKIKNGYVASFGAKDDKIIINGEHYNKIIDTKTGYIVKNGVALVSVLHPDAVIASALSYVCSILGHEKSAKILNYYGADAIFVYNDKSIHITPSVKNNLEVTDVSYKIEN